MPRSECRGRVAVTYSLEVCCNQTGDRYAARRYERARFYREVTATRLAGLLTRSRISWGIVRTHSTSCRSPAQIPPTQLVDRSYLAYVTSCRPPAQIPPT